MSNTANHNGYIPAKEARMVIKNSEVIKVGDWIVDEGAGAANVDAKTEYIVGHAIRFEDSEGRNLESPSADTGSLGGTWAAATKQYTAAADNETVDMVVVVYEPCDENTEYVATLDAAAGTTSGPRGYYFGILTSDSSKLDESDATLTDTGMQFYCTKALTALGTTKVAVKVANRVTTIKNLS